MSDASSDSFSAFDFSEFSEQDLTRIDRSIAKAHFQSHTNPDVSFSWVLDAAALDLSGLDEEDFKSIDAAVAQRVSLDNPHPSTGSPAISIQLEENGDSSSEPDIKREPTPIERYRPKGILSVTDLVSPAWCEVQFDYGLRGRRSRPIETRPKSFKSAAGKEIRVEKAVAAINDETTKQGRIVHKELEREVHAEELKVDITSEEERWALRLINMISCVKGIIMDGFTRELPVFGIIHDEVVVGIVDEVALKPVETSSRSSRIPKRTADHSVSEEVSKRARRTPSSFTEAALDSGQQAACPSNDIPDANKSSQSLPLRLQSLVHPPQFMLHIIDTKTRRSDSLPPLVDTLSSRLQLMLYHRLLNELISIPAPFDFPSFWQRLKLKSSGAFSTRFLVQAQLISENNQFQTICLDDLVRSWGNLVKTLGVSAIDSNLQLVYRLQPRSDLKGKGKMRAPHSHSGAITRKELDDIAAALSASVNVPTSHAGYSSDVQETAGDFSHSSVERDVSEGITGEDLALQRALLHSLLPPESDGQGSYPEVVDGHENSSAGENMASKIIDCNGIDYLKPIGTKEFLNDPPFLEAHLTNVLKWWRGERRPRGVPVDLVRRCNTCEYRNDCEWREEKASELMERKTRVA